MKNNLHRTALTVLLALSILTQLALSAEWEQAKVPFNVSVPDLDDPNIVKLRIDLSNRNVSHDLVVSFTSKDKEYPGIKYGFDGSATESKNLVAAHHSSVAYALFEPSELKDKNSIYIEARGAKTKEYQLIEGSFLSRIELDGYEQWIIERSDIDTANLLYVKLNFKQLAQYHRLTVDFTVSDEDLVTKFDSYLSYSPNELPFNHPYDLFWNQSWFSGQYYIIDQTIINRECSSKDICSFYFMLKLPVQGFEVSCETFYYRQEEALNGTVIDSIGAGSTNTYLLDLDSQDAENDLIIFGDSHNPGVLVHIECFHQDGDAIYYKGFDYSLDKAEEFIMTASEHEMCKNNRYKFSITTKTSSIYVLGFQVMSKDTPLQLKPGVTKTGNIDPSEKIGYQFYTSYDAVESITIQINNITGKFDHYLMKCTTDEQCPGLGILESKKNKGGLGQTNLKLDLTKFTVSEGNTLNITFNPSYDDNCFPVHTIRSRSADVGYQDNDLYSMNNLHCAYYLYISSEEANMPVEYEVLYDWKGHQPLIPGIQFREFDPSSAHKYYIISIPSDDVVEVDIDIHMDVGVAALVASSKFRYPTLETAEYQGHDFLFIEPKNNAKQFTRGTNLYIGVFSDWVGFYTMTAKLRTKDGSFLGGGILLREGHKTKSTMRVKNIHEPDYFKIKVNLPPNTQAEVKIELISSEFKGLLKMRAMRMFFDDGYGDNYESQNNTIIIKEEAIFLQTTLEYEVSVTPNPGVKFDKEKIEYTIMYSTKFTEVKDGVPIDPPIIDPPMILPIPLTNNEPYEGVLGPNEKAYFTMFNVETSESLLIFLLADSKEVVSYLTLDPKIRFPDEEHFDYKNLQDEPVLIEADEYAKHCAKNFEHSYYCKFTLMLENTGSIEDVGYTVLYSAETEGSEFNGNVIQLKEGVNTHAKLPETPEDPKLFYFDIPKDKVAVITVSCFWQEISAFANIEKYVDGSNTGTNLKIPGKGDAQFTFTEDDQVFPGILSMNFTSKFAGVLVLAVHFRINPAIDFIMPPDPIFSIIATSEIQTLRSGQIVKGNLPADHYMYFLVDIKSPDSSLDIQVDAPGDPDIFVSRGLMSRPTFDYCEFQASTEGTVEKMQIKPEYVFPKNNLQGPWVIGIYSKEQTEYKIVTKFSANSVFSLQSDEPLKYSLAKNEELEIQYKPLNDEFTFSVKMNTGVLIANFTVYDVKHQHTPKNDSQKIGQDYSIELQTPQVHNNFGYQGFYQFKLVGFSEQPAAFIVTMSESKFQQIQHGLEYKCEIEKNQQKGYQIIGYQNQPLVIQGYARGKFINFYASHNPTLNKTNYVWHRELKGHSSNMTILLDDSEYSFNQTTIWNGHQDIRSHKNIYYILFENPRDTQLDLQFYVSSETVILSEDNTYFGRYEPDDKASFVYYASDPEKELALEVDVFTDSIVEAIYYPKVEIQFRPPKRVFGESFALDVAPRIQDSRVEGDMIVYNMVYMLPESEGRYSFSFDFQGKAQYGITIYDTKSNYHIVEAGNERLIVLDPHETEKYEIDYPQSGTVFVSVSGCNGSYTVKVDDQLTGEKQKEIFLDQDTKYMFRMTAKDYGSKIFTIEETLGKRAEAYLFTSFVQDTIDINVDEITPGSIQSIQTTNDANIDKRSIKVSFTPPDLSSIQSKYQDKIGVLYEGRICPQTADNQIDYCPLLANGTQDCLLAPLSFHSQTCQMDRRTGLPDCTTHADQDGENGVITFGYIGVREGNFTVSVNARILYKNDFINVIGYKDKQLIFQELSSFSFSELSNGNDFVLILIIGLVALGIIVCVWKLVKGKNSGANYRPQHPERHVEMYDMEENQE